MEDMTITPRVASGAPEGGQFSGKAHDHDRIELMPEQAARPKRLTQLSLRNYNRSIDHVVNRRERLEIDPPYQRGSVWDVERRQNLVKSILIGLPIGAITLNDRGYQVSGKDMAVVDGRQRIEVLWAFVDSEFAIPALWLDETMILETEPMRYEGQTVDGVRFSGTSIVFHRKFSNMPIQMVEASVQGVEAEAEVFLLINAGGVQQTDENIAHATAVMSAREAGYVQGREDADEGALGLAV